MVAERVIEYDHGVADADGAMKSIIRVATIHWESRLGVRGETLPNKHTPILMHCQTCQTHTSATTWFYDIKCAKRTATQMLVDFN